MAATGSLAHYTTADLYGFLADYQLPRDMGVEYEYSNVGYALLGHALALRTETAFSDLLTEYVLAPLRMTATSYIVPPTARKFLGGYVVSATIQVPGYDELRR
jgi:CubicO group peptidase (beta-lactamase class C family)